MPAEQITIKPQNIARVQQLLQRLSDAGKLDASVLQGLRIGAISMVLNYQPDFKPRLRQYINQNVLTDQITPQDLAKNFVIIAALKGMRLPQDLIITDLLIDPIAYLNRQDADPQIASRIELGNALHQALYIPRNLAMKRLEEDGFSGYYNLVDRQLLPAVAEVFTANNIGIPGEYQLNKLRDIRDSNIIQDMLKDPEMVLVGSLGDSLDIVDGDYRI